MRERSEESKSLDKPSVNPAVKVIQHVCQLFISLSRWGGSSVICAVLQAKLTVLIGVYAGIRSSERYSDSSR